MDMLFSQSQSVSASKPSSASLSSISTKSAVSETAAATALVSYNGSTMLSPPLTASCTNPFSSFDWLSAVTPPTGDSSSIVSTSSVSSLAEQRVAAAATAAAVAYTSCRMGQHATVSAPPDFLSMFSSTCGPPGITSGSTNNGFNAETTFMPSFNQIQHQQRQNPLYHHHRHSSRNLNADTSTISSAIVSSSSSSTSSLSLTPTSMTSSPAVPSPHKMNSVAMFNPPGYHLQAPGHGLPSPTIYPPTPPPSAPWIHPWYAGDTF